MNAVELGLQIGDRVRVLRRAADWMGPLPGDMGTILDFRGRPNYSCSEDIKIRWDRFMTGHNCRGLCTEGHGWNFNFYHIGDLIELCREDVSGVAFNASSVEALL